MTNFPASANSKQFIHCLDRNSVDENYEYNWWSVEVVAEQKQIDRPECVNIYRLNGAISRPFNAEIRSSFTFIMKPR